MEDQRKEFKKIVEQIEEDKKRENLPDGIYDVSNIEFIDVGDYLPNEQVDSERLSELKNFIEKYPNCFHVCAYETDGAFLLSEKPSKFTGGRRGSGFNYGSSNILIDCPKNLLILAEND